MIIIKLSGGLGNQMFQYAFGKALGADAYDISFYNNQSGPSDIRHYELDFFNVSPKIFNQKQTKKYRHNNPFLKLFGIKRKIPKIQEETMKYAPDLLNIKKGIVKGYFQCPKYFEHLREELLKEFTPKNTINSENAQILADIQNSNSVAVQIRRSDYLKFKHKFHICDAEYYQKAIAYIAQKIKKPKFFFFSQDMAWIKENILCPFEHIYVDINHGKDSPWDLWLMKNCKHNIIANSTFAWWGAWLNENENKIVIAPKEWFSDGETIDILPPTWLRF